MAVRKRGNPNVSNKEKNPNVGVDWIRHPEVPPVDIVLDPAEVAMAASIGVHRNSYAIDHKLRQNHGMTGDGWAEHIEGASGELALAKHLKMYYGGAHLAFKGPDLGLRYQVRTRSKAWYQLIVRPDDSDNDIFVLVTGKCPIFKIRGWILGKDAKKPEWEQTYGNRPPAFFVPQEFLNPITTLPRD